MEIDEIIQKVIERCKELEVSNTELIRADDNMLSSEVGYQRMRFPCVHGYPEALPLLETPLQEALFEIGWHASYSVQWVHKASAWYSVTVRPLDIFDID